MNNLVFTNDKTYGDMFFQVGGDWIMALTSDGHIKFNRECFPELTIDEFAEVVASKLEEIRLCDIGQIVRDKADGT